MIRRRGRWVKYILLPFALFSFWYFQIDSIVFDAQKEDEKTMEDKFDGFSKIETNMEALKGLQTNKEALGGLQKALKTDINSAVEDNSELKGEIVRRLKETEDGNDNKFKSLITIDAVKTLLVINKDTNSDISKQVFNHKGGLNYTGDVNNVNWTNHSQVNENSVPDNFQAKENNAPEDSLQGNRQNGLPSNLPSDSTEPAKQLNSEIPEINRKIMKMNTEQEILNIDKFGLEYRCIIAIQVHNRIEYLRELVSTLRVAKGIDQTLLVFSHDVWQEDINSLVRSINFTRVMQIFYPYSLQTHPYTFPGESSNDCPRNAKPAEVKKLNCTNKDWPDLYGHFREAKFTQTKHHWWWKANRIFNHLNATITFKGLVVFMEEDHYVTPDFLHVLNLMQKQNNKQKPQKANILSLGTYLKKFNYKENSKQVEMTQWVSSLHNMGMALTRSTWTKILQCQNHFCQYDDYNWDWSLLYVSLNCLREKLQVMVVKGPRIFHIGECGVHHKKKDCTSSAAMNKVKFIIDSAKKYFFPDSLRVSVRVPRRKLKLKKSNGGWGDNRDHQLCLNFSAASTKH